MPKFRKKPVVIEAMQFTDKTISEIMFWIGQHHPKGEQKKLAFINNNGDLIVRTLEGDMKANKNDWIIKGVQNEFYPCKADIFAATYEPVSDSPEKV